MDETNCYWCDAAFVPSPLTNGYGTIDGHRFCLLCCGVGDAQRMQETGRATLYLVNSGTIDGESRWEVINWPGTLRFRINPGGMRKGRHNIARTRYDVWFRAYGQDWHGVQYGENTQVCHVKRVQR